MAELRFYSPQEYMMLRREAMANDKGIIDAREISVAEALSDEIMSEVWANGEFVNWEDLMLKNALYQNHDLTVRGGTDKLRVSAGLNYFDQDGMVTTGSGYKKAAFRLNVDYKVNKWASFGVNTSYALSKVNVKMEILRSSLPVLRWLKYIMQMVVILNISTLPTMLTHFTEHRIMHAK